MARVQDIDMNEEFLQASEEERLQQQGELQQGDRSARVLDKILESKTKQINITCPELDNITFTNNAPFDHLGVPQCNSKVLPEMVLYLPGIDKQTNFTSCDLEPGHLPNKQTDDCFKKITDDASIWKIVILTHGFTKSFDTPWLHSMQKKIMKLDKGTAVIVSVSIYANLNFSTPIETHPSSRNFLL